MKHSVLLIALMAALFLSRCEERDIPVVFDRDEIIRYIHETEEGRDLFRTGNLFLDQQFRIPFDASLYQVVVDSMQRSIDVTVFVDSVRFDSVNRFSFRLRHDYGNPLGNLWDAEAVVDDRFFVKVLRIDGTDTTRTEHQRLITRYGYFLKLGSDNQAYFGWKLWGYNGGSPESPVQLEVRTPDDRVFRGDTRDYERFRYLVHFTNITTGESNTTSGTSEYTYKRVDQLGTIDDGDALIPYGGEIPNESYYQIVTADSDNGFQLQVMHRPDSSHYIDTVKTPDNNSRVWNLLFMQEIRRFTIPGGQPPDTMGTNWFGWCVPFRVD